MTVGDPMAAILGVYYKNSPKIYGEKNIAGSFGHGIFTMIVSLIYLQLTKEVLTGKIYSDGVVIYLTSVISELGFGLSLLGIDDNITMQLISGCIYVGVDKIYN